MPLTDNSNSSSGSLFFSQVDKSYQYPAAYRDSVFLIWYKNGRPGRRQLHGMIPDTEDGAKPHEQTLQNWIEDEEWIQKANDLDREVARRIEEQLVTEKMEMLKEHADLGKRARIMGMDFLENNPDEISGNVAVRLIVEGVKIERDSRGLSNLMDELSQMSDEKLIEKLKKTIEGKEFDIEELEANLIDADTETPK